MPRIWQYDPTFPARQICEAAARYADATLSRAGIQVIKVHRVVFSDYDHNDPAHTITLQLAIELMQNDMSQQARYSLCCRKRACDDIQGNIANCQNCGTPLGDSTGKCPYCDTDNAIRIEDFWYFFDLKTC